MHFIYLFNIEFKLSNVVNLKQVGFKVFTEEFF